LGCYRATQSMYYRHSVITEIRRFWLLDCAIVIDTG
jgi:hypothetical protein